MSHYYYYVSYQCDVLGLLTPEGALAATYLYDAWGNLLDDALTLIGSLNPLRYRSYYYESDLSLYYLQSRYYDSTTGRFISTDSTDYLDPSHLQGMNLYTYGLNNPVTYLDVSGQFPILTILTITAIVGLGLTIGGVSTDNNVMTAIGLTMVAIPALITGGMAVCATTAMLTNIVGGVTIFAGLGTATFATAEWQQAFTGVNWILNTGLNEGLYNGLMIGFATVATLGTAASSFTYSYRINSIRSAGRFGDYYGMRFDTAAGETRVLSFHTHGHGGGISQWHWQLQKWNPMTMKTASTVGRWSWWEFWTWG